MPCNYPEWTCPFMNLGIAGAESRLNHFPTSAEGWVEGGVDWTPTIPGTPITALAPGTIIGAGYFCKNPSNFFASSPNTCGGSVVGYGVVTIRSINKDGSLTDIYYQHIIIGGNIILSDSGGVGQTVIQGDQIGVSNPSFNVEVGVNIGFEWGGIWGNGKSPGPHVDPIPYLYNLISTGGGSSTFIGLGTFIGGASTAGQEGLQLVDELIAAAKESNFYVRSALVITGAAMGIIALNRLTRGKQ